MYDTTASSPDARRNDCPLVSVRYHRKQLLEAIGQTLDHPDLSTTVRLALDEFVDRRAEESLRAS